jgi:hypothetical protein
LRIWSAWVSQSSSSQASGVLLFLGIVYGSAMSTELGCSMVQESKGCKNLGSVEEV